MNDIQDPDFFHTCAWCGNSIDENGDFFGFGARASHNIDLSNKTGQFVSLRLSLIDKTTFAMVPEKSSDSLAEDHDLLFITCSEDCAINLKEALDLERDVFSDD
ncbi:MAG: hypothetical protein ACK2UM_10840 [Anaerolineales bacterium]|jgi:hypothetical protein